MFRTLNTNFQMFLLVGDGFYTKISEYLLDCNLLFTSNHLEMSLALSARLGVFEDSGSWETAILRLCDFVIRGWIWSSILPISEQGIGEQASSKVNSILSYLSQSGQTRILFSVSSSLYLFGKIGVLLLGSYLALFSII